MPKSIQQPLPPWLLENYSAQSVARTNDSLEAKRTSERTRSSQDETARTKDTQPDAATILASELFDAAMTDARLTSGEVSHLLGVSESLINRMRSPNYREGVSLVQMLRLPIEFHWHLHKVMSRRLGLRKRAVAELLDAVGSIALVTE